MSVESQIVSSDRENETVFFSRKEYMEKKCSHREYYSQFVTEYHIRAVKEIEFDSSLRTWDNLYLSPLKISMKSVGDILSACGKVCILKEAKRQQLAREV